MTRVVVAGAIANKVGNGGEAWVRLSWVLGLSALGCDVHLVEQIEPQQCVDAHGRPTPFRASTNLAWFRAVAQTSGLVGRMTLVCGPDTWGHTREQLATLAGESDLLINISGHLRGPLLHAFPTRAYVDIDPGYTQIWHAQGVLGSALADHDVHFSIAENIGHSSCSLPTADITWRTVRPPVVLDHWPRTGPPDAPLRFTTIASWRGAFGPLAHDGHTYGLKAHEFRKLATLPQQSAAAFEVALAIHPADDADIRLMTDGGWVLTDPGTAAGTPEDFRTYVQGSHAECSVAQGVYVHTRSGWFSDRTTRYLASGRPALVQDTGFARTLPVGDGLVPFSTAREAAQGAQRIARDYDAHAAAARQIAEECFDAATVLPPFLADAGVGG